MKPEHHHTDLTIMHAIMALCEGGCLYTSGGKAAASKIVKICSREAAKQLNDYDAAKRESRP